MKNREILNEQPTELEKINKEIEDLIKQLENLRQVGGDVVSFRKKNPGLFYDKTNLEVEEMIEEWRDNVSTRYFFLTDKKDRISSES